MLPEGNEAFVNAVYEHKAHTQALVNAIDELNNICEPNKKHPI